MRTKAPPLLRAPSRRDVLLWPALAVPLGLGCGDGAMAPAAIELGTGLERFEPLPTTDGTIELVFGPQGGWHFDVTARLENLDPEDVTLEYAAIDDATGRALHYPARYRLNARRVVREGPWLLRLGDRVVLDITREEDALGRMVLLTLEASVDGRVRARDQRLLRIVDERR